MDCLPGRKVTAPGASHLHLIIDHIKTSEEKHHESGWYCVEVDGIMWFEFQKTLAVLFGGIGQMSPATCSNYSLCFLPIYHWRPQSMSRFSVSLISPPPPQKKNSASTNVEHFGSRCPFLDPPTTCAQLSAHPISICIIPCPEGRHHAQALSKRGSSYNVCTICARRPTA